MLLLFNCIGNCFSGIWLTKMGQHVVVVVDVGISEVYIPSDLQLKQTFHIFCTREKRGSHKGFVATAAQ